VTSAQAAKGTPANAKSIGNTSRIKKAHPRMLNVPMHRNAPGRARVVKQLRWSDTSRSLPPRQCVPNVAQRGLFVQNRPPVVYALK
jgi:hypothetical protein